MILVYFNRGPVFFTCLSFSSSAILGLVMIIIRGRNVCTLHLYAFFAYFIKFYKKNCIYLRNVYICARLDIFILIPGKYCGNSIGVCMYLSLKVKKINVKNADVANQFF